MPENTHEPSSEINSPTTEREELPILFQDEHFVVINKPGGLLVHRSMIDRHEIRFALQILRNQLGQHVFPLHRLDKPTSGALIFALSREAAQAFNTDNAMKGKTYLAVTRGYAPESVAVDHALKEELDKIADKKAQQDKPPQDALTHFKCLATTEIDAQVDRYPQSRYSLVECRPITGRKHQIRRHLKHISHPIIGDAKHGKGNHNRYFAKHFSAPRLLLHASRLDFTHPYTKESISVTAPLDDCMTQLLHRFNWAQHTPKAGTTTTHQGKAS